MDALLTSTSNMQAGFHAVNLPIFTVMPPATGSTTVLLPQNGDVEATCR
jgi:hypothetical protein